MEPVSREKIQSVIGIVLFAVMILLAVFSVKFLAQVISHMMQSNRMITKTLDDESELYRNYVSLYQQSERHLVETTRQLNSTQMLLSQTEDMIAEIRKTNNQLQQELAALRSAPSSAGTDSSTQTKVVQVKQELAGLKDQLEQYQGEIKDTKEGLSLVALFKEKLRVLNRKMQHLREEARQTQIAARKEKDRELWKNGNQGFVVKNGSPNPAVAGEATKKKEVKIKVSFF